jgi:hypothetical protein
MSHNQLMLSNKTLHSGNRSNYFIMWYSFQMGWSLNLPENKNMFLKIMIIIVCVCWETSQVIIQHLLLFSSYNSAVCKLQIAIDHYNLFTHFFLCSCCSSFEYFDMKLWNNTFHDYVWFYEFLLFYGKFYFSFNLVMLFCLLDGWCFTLPAKALCVCVWIYDYAMVVSACIWYLACIF